MTALSIVAALRAKPGKEDELRRDLLALVDPSRGEDGNIQFDLLEDPGEPGRFVLVEEWSSLETRNRHHEHGPHIQHFHANGAVNIEKSEFAHTLKRVA
jgi:quinol monooxygenase YgiN